jgi:hypothetical protein
MLNYIIAHIISGDANGNWNFKVWDEEVVYQIGYLDTHAEEVKKNKISRISLALDLMCNRQVPICKENSNFPLCLYIMVIMKFRLS